jgi:hypothetical protein
LFFFELLGAVKIVFRFNRWVRRYAAGNMTQMLLDAIPELIRSCAQFIVSELLYLRLESINRRNPGHHALDDPFVLGPKDLANQSVNQTVKSFRGRELP